MGKVLKGGFTYKGVSYKEPNSIRTACSMLEDVMNSSRLQQYGGWTCSEIDTVLAPYVKKTWVNYYNYMSGGTDFPADTFADEMTWRDLVQGLESIEHSLHMVNNTFITFTFGLDTSKFGQMVSKAILEVRTWRDLVQGLESIEHSLHMVNNTFITFTFGLDTSKFGQMVSKAILEVRRKGLGTTGIPAVFPKLVFLYTDKLHGEGMENEHIFSEAIATSSKCMYPDYLSLDEGYLGEVYSRTGKAISPMGK